MTTDMAEDDDGSDLVGIDRCSGNEASILDCARAAVTSRQVVGINCLTSDDLSARCGAGELPFGDTCFYLGRERVTQLKATILCDRRGGLACLSRSSGVMHAWRD